MVEYEDYKSLTDINLIKKHLTSYGFSYSETLTDNTFTFKDNIIHAKSLSGKNSFLSLFYMDLEIGDEIEVEFECRNISGDKVLINISETPQESAWITYKYIENKFSNYSNQWQKVRHKYIIRNTYHSNVVIQIGLRSSDVGEYQIRNIRTVAKRQKFKPQQRIECFSIKKEGGTWNQKTTDYTTTNVTVSEKDENTLKLAFDNIFAITPVPILTKDYGVNFSYTPIIGEVGRGVVSVKFLKGNNSLALLSEVTNLIQFHCALIGY